MREAYAQPAPHVSFTQRTVRNSQDVGAAMAAGRSEASIATFGVAPGPLSGRVETVKRDMDMKSLALAAVAFVVVASPAIAQTAKVSGPRVEANVGWDRVVLKADGESEGKSGVTYGGEIGYDVMIGSRAVLGAYAGIDGASTKDCDSDGTLSGCVKAGRNLTAGARVGYLVGPTSLLYVKGGYSNGRIQVSVTETAAPAFAFDDGVNLRGFHVGAGAEVGLGHGLYGKAEYSYTNYESFEFVGTVNPDRHRVVIGAGFRF
ncbi:porin family protein [Sphingomonas ginsenosidivorax]|uniref:Porin family protein n=1 Tax=Sphingomonas ginsenosidivorax TaxID=862135 RepID=A0A5C6UHQ5_9SPHN|nr:porin family protein [Sphingomonas ginsenosidivorax]TXC72219.1 porin family protein [Sphingomonas ginsenosidivorax]